MKLFAIVALCLSVAATPTVAQETEIPGVVEVHLFYTGGNSATALQFMLELSSYDWVHLGDEWNFSTTIGTSVSGVVIGFGGCMNAPVHLGVARFYAGQVTCTEVRIVGDPISPSGMIEVIDCAGGITYPSSDVISANYDPCGVKPPANLQPPDGALGVDLNPTLTWTWEGSTNCPGGIGMVVCQVYLGTAPDNLASIGSTFPSGPLESFELTAGPLPPATQHYWRVRVTDEYWDCPGSHEAWSETQSFYTQGAVPVELTTWGRIKGLYR